VIPRVTIFTNLPQRDQTVDDLIATHLRKMGYEVWVRAFLPDNREHVLHFKPHIIVFPEARCEYTIEFIKTCQSWGIKCVIRRCEGGSATAAYELMEASEKETVIGAWPYTADLEIVWSEEFADLLGKEGYGKREDIYAAGGFPFDSYFPHNRQFPPVEEGRKNVLFAPGWGHSDRNPEYNVPEAPPGSPIHKDAYDRHRKGRTKWLEMIRALTETYKDQGYSFFLRPKTGEVPLPYQNTVGDCLALVQPCPPEVALHNTDIIIHAGSTMGVEANFFGIPGLSYCGNYNQVPGYEFPHVHPEYEDLDKFIEAFGKLKPRVPNGNMKAIRQLSKEFYGKMDGHACLRTAKKIAELEVTPEIVTPNLWPVESRYFESQAFTHAITWNCECCHRNCVTELGKEMIKCPWCGIALARRLEDAQIKK